MSNSYSAYDRIIYGGFISEDICIPKKFLTNMLTVIFPPLGVLYNQYQNNFPSPMKIFTCIILTSLFYFPGLIYALNSVNCNSAGKNQGYYGDPGLDAKYDTSVATGVR